MSRSASAAPRSPATVEKRANISVFLPIAEKIAARVYLVMSWVTVKVPNAPDPFACMRRSGITSRSKWASFSRNHTSSSSAGPRGPAVRMFWLSTTGAPKTVVSFFMRDPSIYAICNGSRSVGLSRRISAATAARIVRVTGLAVVPCGTQDDLAKIQAPVRRIAQFEHVGLDVAEGRLGLLDCSLREGTDDAVLEVLLTRMRSHDLNPLFVAEVVVSHAEHVHLDPGGHERDDRLQMFRHARRGMQRNRQPHLFDVVVVHAVLRHEIARGIGAIHFETVAFAA